MDDRAQQKAKIKQALQTPLAKGAVWCVLSARWWDQWRDYVGFDRESASDAAVGVARPPAINNSAVVGSDGQVRSGLIEPDDYVVVPRDAWDLLVQWYAGGPVVSRVVVEDGVETKLLRVEVHLLRLRILVCDKDGKLVLPGHESFYSKKEALRTVFTNECARLKLDATHTRMFTMDGQGDELMKEEMLDNLDMTLEDATVADLQRLFFQTRSAKAKDWPPLPTDAVSKGNGKKNGVHGAAGGGGGGGFWSNLFGRGKRAEQEKQHGAVDGNNNNSNHGGGAALATTNGSSSSSSAGAYASDGDHAEMNYDNVSVQVAQLPDGGLCGLINLGNTCFMNAALQALLHADVFVNYFLSGVYKKEINKKNPLGQKGDLANAFANLVKEIWHASAMSCTSPKQVKHVIGRFAPQFSGFQQQDAQELLAYLLDGVHEDLNRVETKPYVDTDVKNAGQKDDPELAAIFWNFHTMRNRSVVVDLFHGQLKSTLVCPQDGGCSNVSVTFDPFAYLSVPFPQAQDARRFIEVAVARDCGLWDGPWFSEMPVKYSVEVKSSELVSDLIVALKSQLAADPFQKSIGWDQTKSFMLCDQIEHRIMNYRVPSQSVSQILTREQLFGFVLPSGSDTLLFTYVAFSHHKQYSGKMVFARTTEAFGLPFVCAFLLDQTTVLEMYQAAWRAMSCYMLDTVWVNVGEPVFFETSEPSIDVILAAKIAAIARGPPPELENDRTGSWRVHYVRFTKPDHPRNGHMVLQTQILRNKHKISEFPFRLRWSRDFQGRCQKCSGVECGGCDIADAALADVGGIEAGIDVEKVPVQLIKLRGRISALVHWNDEEKRLRHFDDAQGLSVRLNASVKANRAFAQAQAMAGPVRLSLYECVGQFQQNERLDKNNEWFCPSCRQHRQAWKMLQIYSLPRILVVHLKRFRSAGMYRQKVEAFVDFPLVGLDLTPYTKMQRPGGWIYDCFAVVNHSGGLGGGHYTAFAMHPVSKKWLLFDDSRVKECKESDVVTAAAYVIFYVRRE